MRSVSMTLIALCLIAAAAAGCGGVQTLDKGTVKTVSLKELSEMAPAEGGAAPVGPGPLIVHIQAGEKIPLGLTFDTPFAAIETTGENAIAFKRDVYLYIEQKGAMLGFDGVRFARLGDWKTLKKLTGVEKGSLSVSFTAGKTEAPRIDVKAGLK
jgi:hypothetical protein